MEAYGVFPAIFIVLSTDKRRPASAAAVDELRSIWMFQAQSDMIKDYLSNKLSTLDPVPAVRIGCCGCVARSVITGENVKHMQFIVSRDGSHAQSRIVLKSKTKNPPKAGFFHRGGYPMLSAWWQPTFRLGT